MVMALVLLLTTVVSMRRMEFSWRKFLPDSVEEGKDELKPLPFVQFFERDLGEVKLSPEQRRECEIAVGEGGQEGDAIKFFTFGTRPLEVYWVWGKGSGKGMISSALQLYVVYMLHFLPGGPFKYFGISKSVPLGIVSVSMTEDQASRILQTVKRMLKNSKFFRQFPILDGNRLINPDECAKNLEPIRITNDKIIFSQIGLVFSSVASKNENFEGNTLVGWIMDEASGHESEAKLRNADKNYATLTTSCRELPYLGIVTSFPRLDEKTDFTWLLYKDALKEMAERMRDFSDREDKFRYPTKYGSQFAVWYIKPKEFFSEETENVFVSEFDLTLSVPVSLTERARRRRLKNQIAKFAGLPVGYVEEDKFVEFVSINPEEHLIDPFRTQLISYETAVVQKPEGLKFTIALDTLRLNYSPIVGLDYLMGIDLGDVDCQTAVVLGHAETRDGTSVLVIDQIFLWRTDKARGISVDSENVLSLIRLLVKKFRVSRVKSDKWNTLFLKQSIPGWEDSPVLLQDYLSLRDLMFTSPARIRLPNCPESRILIEQIRNLGSQKGNRKPRVLVGYQDLLDATVAVVSLFTKYYDSPFIGEGYSFLPEASGTMAVGKVGLRKVDVTPFQIIRPSAQLSLSVGSPGFGPPNPSRMGKGLDISSLLERFGIS